VTTESTLKRSDVPAAARDLAPGEGTVLWVLWMTYGAFYFCRQNIAAAVPGIGDELGYSKAEIGSILAALKLAYAVGQLVNGQLAERFSPRQLLAVGMLGSAALNVVFGFSTGLYFLLFVWACNGYCQALGWTPCMRVAANWIPSHRRGRLIGVLGTSYQAMAALTFVIAGWSVAWFGWRGAFYVPALLLAAAAVHMLLFLRESPAVSWGEANGPGDRRVAAGGTWQENLQATLTNPGLWFLALALGLLDACRYGFTDWGLTHLKEVQNTRVELAALKYAVLPAGGIAGALLAGWATDRFFQGRRAPVIAGLLVLLGILTLVYDWMARTSATGTILLLVLIGFCIFGPQVLLVGTAPADLARRGTAAAAAGFVNFMGYLGAFAGDYVTGYVAGNHGWQTAVFWWAGWAFAAALAAACLWNARAK
jgi:sugar phosphate permease